MAARHPGGALMRAFDLVIDAMNLVGSALIASLVVLLGADVLMRNLANAPIAGVPEIVSLSILAIVTLQLPYAVRGGRLTRSDALIERLPAHLRGGLYRAFDVVALIVALAIAWFSWPLLAAAWRNDLFIGAVGTFTAPVWPVRATLVFSIIVLALQFLRQIVRPTPHGVHP